MSRIFNNFVLLYPSLQAMHKIKIKTLKLIKLYQLHRQGWINVQNVVKFIVKFIVNNYTLE